MSNIIPERIQNKTMSKQTTAVEWLETKVNGMIENGGDADLLAVIEHIQQAKAIFEQQIIDAYKYGVKDEYVIGAKQYYKEAFGSHNSTNNSD